MATQFQWITYAAARSLLAGRLADPSKTFWTDAEIGIYLQEALRTWNALTEQWNANFSFLTSGGGGYGVGGYGQGGYGSGGGAVTWYDISQLSNSPRARTLHDSDLYTIMEYHLLEPPTGAMWTGTSQFSIADLQGALQRRRDEVIQVAGCNLAQLPPLASTYNQRRTFFPDSTLEPMRMRFVPDSTAGPITLCREDTLQFDAFEPGYLQSPALPSSWSVITEPPLAFDVDTAPGVTGNYDVISLQAGPTFQPPFATLLGIPDDFAWVAKMGALSDLLGRESEATDRLRADYYAQRYADGLKLIKESNWLVSATINGLPCDTPSLKDFDAFSPEWELNAAAWSTLVQAGVDFVAPCPVGIVSSVGMVLVGNAPIPVLDSDYVQVSRDVWDAVLSYAQFLAVQKMGGAEFTSAMELEKQFFEAAKATNKRLANMGIFSDVVHSVGKKQDVSQPR
jgi:hypothetical protein